MSPVEIVIPKNIISIFFYISGDPNLFLLATLKPPQKDSGECSESEKSASKNKASNSVLICYEHLVLI